MYLESSQLQTFYDGLSNTSRILLDSSADGSLQLKILEEAMELIELVANNQYMFTSDRNIKRGVME
ncbi:hypothetical protein PIB30_099190, partial [Stylosanthes scabra]|nr:hypothetical protein [Stylosanthes scabra]